MPNDDTPECPAFVRDAIMRYILEPHTMTMGAAAVEMEIVLNTDPECPFVMAVGPGGATHQQIIDEQCIAPGAMASLSRDWCLHVSTANVARYTATEVHYIVGHELVHYLRGDPWWLARVQLDGHVRGRPFINEIAQLSMDAGVNSLLNTENEWATKTRHKIVGFMGTMPAVAFVHPDIDWTHSQDDAYCILYDQAKKNGGGGGGNKGKGEGDGFGDDVKPGKSRRSGGSNGESEAPTRAEIDRAASEHRVKFRELLERSRQAGSLSGDMVRLLDERAVPTYDLSTLLDAVVPVLLEGNDREDFSRPNRRFAHEMRRAMDRGERVCIQPMTMSYRVGRVAVLVDVSGSMMRDDLVKAFGTVADVLERYEPSEVLMLAGDTEVSHFETLTCLDDLRQASVRGGGGTDMGVCLEQLASHLESEQDGEELSLAIVATDGYTPWPARDVGFSVLAILTQESARPPEWIKTIRWG